MTVTVSTYNAPHRLLHHGLVDDFRRLAAHSDIIVAQEQTDHDPTLTCPPGWSYYRPDVARHNVVYWNPDTVEARKRGRVQVNKRDGATWTRFIVWVHFGTAAGPLRVGGIHLPAFKTSRPANAAEFRHQERLLAQWLDGGKNRCLAGDFNAQIPSRVWTPNLSRVGRWSPKVVSGPHRAKIDYVGVSRRGRWRVRHATTMSGGSDHKAVIATLGRNTR